MAGRALAIAAASLACSQAAPARVASAASDYDLVVYGATPGGVMAAAAAANESLKVLLIHNLPHVGGMSAGGLGWTDVGNPAAIGGAALAYFQANCVARHLKPGNGDACWQLTPRVAEQLFLDLIDAHNVTLMTNYSIVSAVKVGTTVKSATFVPTPNAEEGSNAGAVTFSAPYFIDASYEGDLVWAAGVSYATGREARSEYNESYNGRMPAPWSGGGHQFGFQVNPYTDASNTSVLPMIWTGDVAPIGSSDSKEMAFNFRMCLTQNTSNQVPLPKPANYDPSYWELFRRYLAHNPAPAKALSNLMIISNVGDDKTDINNSGAISTDFIGGSWSWANATPAQRKAIWQAHFDYTAGFFYFLANDAAVPASVQSEMRSWGLCADEFTDHGGWPWQLYVRSARRMVGDFVFTQWDRYVNKTKPDSIGLYSYNMDCHNAERILVNSSQGVWVRNEGDIEVGGSAGIGQIPYRMITPKAADANNLLAPVPASASHVAFGAIRLEPQWMIMGQSSGIAAAQALKAGQAVQDIDIAQLQARLREVGQLLDIPAQPEAALDAATQ